MLRPTLVLACGLACAKDAHATPSALLASRFTDAHITLAAVCEMVHMATLVHDDVLDEAQVRRRGLTVNALRGNEAAVILGDHLIATAYALCATLDSPIPAREIGLASVAMCGGELLQLHHRNDFSLAQATYDEIIRRKTGALIAVSCRLGAWASGASSEVQEALATFGSELGVAFQIQDDVLDLTGDQSVVGKSVAKDLEKGKMTLPLIHHLRVASPSLRDATLKLLDAAITSPQSAAEAVPLVREALHTTGSVSHARDTAHALVAQARARLSVLPSGLPRTLLDRLAQAVVERSF